ncbi:interleukin-17 receptor C isoform X8 [Mustela nigripes]|uniref:interleukin-17 receptor C isoform X8 n=1 Tax=Mustela nigripes TaxID=77151 RepID=UPI002816286F|nr:interleukin-17 receptor C isoform X8 [Mustela nigripes]
MPVPWFLLSLALGRSPMVLSLEKLMGPQDTARCSPGLSCHLWDGDVLCLPGSIVSAPGPVLVPTRLQTELVLRCHQETDCDLCVRVAIHLAVHGHWEEPKDEDRSGRAADLELEEPRNAFLQAQVVLSFQAYPTARCVLLEVQVPAALVQPGQSVVWPLEPDSVRTSLCPFKEDPRAHRNLWRAARLRLLSPQGWQLNAPCLLLAEATLCWQAPGGGPCLSLVPPLSRENVTVNKTLELPLLNAHPNLCVQVSNWEKLQLQECLWADSLGALKDDMLLLETRGPQDNRSLCALEPSGCTPLLSQASTRAARLGEQLLQDLQSGQCLQLWEDDLRALWACPMDKYVHQRWALVWLACLLLASALFLLFLVKKNQVKGWLRLLKEDLRAGAVARGRATLLVYSAEDSGFERLVGALASALCQLPLRVAVDLWSRRELSAQGPLAWFHAQRRQALQEGGVVVLLFSPGAVALCHEWLQDGASASAPHGPHDAFAASLSCVLPDFLQGRAPGRYVGAYFEGLLHSEAVPALFRSVPVFSLPSQLPDFLRTLQGPGTLRPGRLGERAKRVSRALQPALDQLLQPPGDPGDPEDGTRVGT